MIIKYHLLLAYLVANTDPTNVAGATAVKAMVSEINGNLSNIFTFLGTYNAEIGNFSVTVARDIDPGTYLVAVSLQGTCNNGAGHISVTLGNITSSAYAESSFNPEAQVTNIIKVTGNRQIIVSGYCNIAQQNKSWACTCIKLS